MDNTVINSNSKYLKFADISLTEKEFLRMTELQSESRYEDKENLFNNHMGIQ